MVTLKNYTLVIMFCPMIYVSHLMSTDSTWENWAGTHRCGRTMMFPGNREDLSSIIKGASIHGKKIRVVGSGHFVNDIVCTNDWLLTLKNLHRILGIDENNQVTVEAGITLIRLNHLLVQKGLALPNIPAVVDQTLGGAILYLISWYWPYRNIIKLCQNDTVNNSGWKDAHIIS